MRLASQLEAHLGQSTIVSNVKRHLEHPIMQAELEAPKLFNFGARATESRETYQERTITQWQKN